tara:strand:+ start:2527 stop:3936 length:1410 start_codon:yes stop_codon:yes gene_type:complete
MSSTEKIALMSHLMRRAGFGAPRAEIEKLAELDYESVVESMLVPRDDSEVDLATLYRYHPASERTQNIGASQLNWLYRMVTTTNPLREKMTLFWHHVFATGDSKVECSYQMLEQIELFRNGGMGSYRDLLLDLAKDPAMLYWLDQNENHKRAPNENFGREILELFSMGTSNYTEKDVFECSRAFTGWSMGVKIHHLLWGPHLWPFEFHPEDHDTGQKSFLGNIGQFNGEEIIDIIVEQPACHRFIMRHLYNFFVADEPQVPAWPIEPPRDPKAIEAMCEVFVSSGYDMTSVLRYLFNAEFFKNSQYQKVRNPAEVIVGTLLMTGDMLGPDPRWGELGKETGYMGQALLDPPSVEGWHTGKEWINSGALINRVNFMADRVSDLDLPGVKDLVNRIASSNGKTMTPEHLVNGCLDMVGPMAVEEDTRKELVSLAETGGSMDLSTEAGYQDFSNRVTEVFGMIAGTREYQFG